MSVLMSLYGQRDALRLPYHPYLFIYVDIFHVSLILACSNLVETLETATGR